MHLSKFTDYSLRVLIYLGGKKDRLSTIDEIAQRYQISKDHLRKIIHHLSKEGWIDSRRGRGGGIILAKNPADISIGAVVRKAEGTFNIADCFDPNTVSCQLDGACRLKFMLNEALSAFLNVLDGYTLADILVGEEQILQRLGLWISPAGDTHEQIRPQPLNN